MEYSVALEHNDDMAWTAIKSAINKVVSGSGDGNIWLRKAKQPYGCDS